MRMNINRAALPFLLAAVLMAASCSSDEDTADYTGDCAITSVVMGTLYRDYTTQTADGRDTSYVITLPASYYPLHIDHLRGLIYNTDSLPVGTRVNRVRFSTFSADGNIVYRLDSGKDTLYSSSDSLDMTHPRRFTVYASNGIDTKQYVMTVNVAHVDENAYTWRQEADAGISSPLSADRALTRGGELFVFGSADGKTRVLSRPTAGGNSWTAQDASGLTSGKLTDITLFGGRFYALDGGMLSTSENGVEWTQTGLATAIERIMGAGSTELYLLAGGTLYRTTDGLTLTAEEADESLSMLPLEETGSVYWTSKVNSSIENVLLAGFDGSTPRIWKKEVNKTGTENNVWSYYPVTDDNARILPRLEGMSLFAYNGNIYALGTCEEQLTAWISEDGGRTWQKRTNRNILPAALKEEKQAVAATDSEGHIWVFCPQTGHVWRGYMNKMAQ